MPTLVQRNRGGKVSWEIRVYTDGQQKTITLGSRRDVHTCFKMVSGLVESKRKGTKPPPVIYAWIERIDSRLRDRLSELELITERMGTCTLTDLYERWRNYPVDRKENTFLNNRTAFRHVQKYFADDQLADEVTEEDALRFKRFLASEKQSPATITGIFRKINGWYSLGIKLGMVTQNPFKAVKCAPMENESRQFYVRPEWYRKIIASCPDQNWRTLVCLARIGGLRVDSETSVLRWEDVDFANGLMTVRSPKTERYAGKARRIIPLYPELRAELKRQRAITDDDGMVLPPNFRGKNLRQQFFRIIFRAGLRPWEKLFNNLRASREMDLLEVFPAHVVSAWMGHSVVTERKHYVFARKEDYAKALTFTK